MNFSFFNFYQGSSNLRFFIRYAIFAAAAAALLTSSLGASAAPGVSVLEVSKPVGLSYLIGEAKNLEIVKVEGRIVKQLEKNRYLLTDRSGHAVEVVLDPKFGLPKVGALCQLFARVHKGDNGVVLHAWSPKVLADNAG